MRHAETLISLQWYVLVLTLRLAVYMLFAKTSTNLGKKFLHPQKYALPYIYDQDITRFDSKFKDSPWRSRTSGNLTSPPPGAD